MMAPHHNKPEGIHMDFKQAVLTCLRDKYFEFNGRAGRSEFWWFFLFQFVVMFVTSMFSNILYGIAVLALLLPGLGAGARRLHDIGKSGWFLLLGFIPLVGALILIYFFVQPSAAANQWGEGPAVAPEAAETPPGAV